VLGDHKSDFVYGRLVRRLRRLGTRQFAEYCTLITGPDGRASGSNVNASPPYLTRFFATASFRVSRARRSWLVVQRRGRRLSDGCDLVRGARGARSVSVA